MATCLYPVLFSLWKVASNIAELHIYIYIYTAHSRRIPPNTGNIRRIPGTCLCL